MASSPATPSIGGENLRHLYHARFRVDPHNLSSFVGDHILGNRSSTLRLGACSIIASQQYSRQLPGDHESWNWDDTPLVMTITGLQAYLRQPTNPGARLPRLDYADRHGNGHARPDELKVSYGQLVLTGQPQTTLAANVPEQHATATLSQFKNDAAKSAAGESTAFAVINVTDFKLQREPDAMNFSGGVLLFAPYQLANILRTDRLETGGADYSSLATQPVSEVQGGVREP